MTRALCARCDRRKVRTTTPSPPGDVGELLGLRQLDGTRYACAACGQEYVRHDESEYLDPDRVTSHFDMVGLSSKRKKEKAGATVVHLASDEPPAAAPAAPPPAVHPAAPESRCPKCGAPDFDRDAFLSDLSFDVYRCEACGHSETIDLLAHEARPAVVEPAPSVETPTLPAVPTEALAQTRGCSQCAADDASRAWKASGAQVVRVLKEEPHEGLRVIACTCGQSFLERFSERVRFDGEGDDVTVIRTPVSEAAVRWLVGLSDALVERGVGELVRGRRSLVSEQPLTGNDAWWRTL